MDDSDLRRIKKAATVQTAGRNEIAPLLATVTKVESDGRCAEAAIGSCDGTLGLRKPLARSRRNVDHDAGLLSIFSRWCAGDDLHRLNGIERNLVGENLALLIGDGLAIYGERILRVIPQTMKESVRVRGDARRGERHQRTDR